jgi:hypothetical protein
MSPWPGIDGCGSPPVSAVAGGDPAGRGPATDRYMRLGRRLPARTAVTRTHRCPWPPCPKGTSCPGSIPGHSPAPAMPVKQEVDESERLSDFDCRRQEASAPRLLLDEVRPEGLRHLRQHPVRVPGTARHRLTQPPHPLVGQLFSMKTIPDCCPGCAGSSSTALMARWPARRVGRGGAADRTGRGAQAQQPTHAGAALKHGKASIVWPVCCSVLVGGKIISSLRCASRSLRGGSTPCHHPSWRGS